MQNNLQIAMSKIIFIFPLREGHMIFFFMQSHIIFKKGLLFLRCRSVVYFDTAIWHHRKQTNLQRVRT